MKADGVNEIETICGSRHRHRQLLRCTQECTDIPTTYIDCQGYGHYFTSCWILAGANENEAINVDLPQGLHIRFVLLNVK